MTGTWVVYETTLRANPAVMRAVCEQGEWDLMDLARPGRCTLVRSGIPTEREADAIARGDSFAEAPRPARLRKWQKVPAA